MTELAPIHERIDTLRDELSLIADSHAELTAVQTYLHERADHWLSRARDRAFHNPDLAEQFMIDATSAVYDLKDVLAPPLTDDEQQSLFEYCLDMAGDMSTKEVARMLLEGYGPIETRETLAEMDT